MATSTGRRGLSVREAAQRAGRAEETVRRWIWSGRLPAHKSGNVLNIDERDLESVLEAAFKKDIEASGDRRPRETLGDWVTLRDAWFADVPVGHGASAADLVLEDRDQRAGR